MGCNPGGEKRHVGVDEERIKKRTGLLRDPAEGRAAHDTAPGFQLRLAEVRHGEGHGLHEQRPIAGDGQEREQPEAAEEKLPAEQVRYRPGQGAEPATLRPDPAVVAAEVRAAREEPQDGRRKQDGTAGNEQSAPPVAEAKTVLRRFEAQHKQREQGHQQEHRSPLPIGELMAVVMVEGEHAGADDQQERSAPFVK